MGKDQDEAERAYDEHLAAAQAAASDGDAAEMLRHLFTTPLVDGLSRRLTAQWRMAPKSVVDNAIASAIDALFAEVKAGSRILSVAAFIWKVAHRRMVDFDRSSPASEAIRSPDEMDEIQRPEVLDPEAADSLRRRAIAIARRLLPQLGQGQVIEVMTMLIDAVEADRPDLPAAEIGEALGMTPGAARSLVTRGLQRLERLARAEGHAAGDLSILSENQNDDPDPDDEEM